MFVARQSNHINEDLKRQWSSWNFGQEGFEGTESELQEYLASCDDENPVYISGVELYPSELKRTKFGELYNNYWVVKDDRFLKRLAVNVIPCDNQQDAIKYMQQNGEWFCGGDGDMVDTSDAELVWSNGDIHILKISE